MRVVEPHEFKNVKHPKKKRKRGAGLRVFILIVVCGYLGATLLRPIPAITSTAAIIAPVEAKEVSITWPAYGQAAVGAVGYGVLGTNGEQKALPTASVAKVMTALAVLKARPLQPGDQGPKITITQEDVDNYAETVAMGGSNTAVAIGEEITEYQAIQALLLPSSNNMANTLARWAFGSQEKYVAFANNFAKSLGMEDTHFDDASGFSPETVSTTQDLTKLAVNAMDNPVIAEIAAQKDAVIPVAGRIYNVNNLLGRDNIVGLKTGNTEEAGGCFMAAAVKEINGKKIIAVSVIMGAPNRDMALEDSVPLVNSVLDGFEYVTVVKSGQSVGTLSIPWAGTADLNATSEISGIAWRGKPVHPEIDIDEISGSKAQNSDLGKVFVRFGRDEVDATVVTSKQITTPSLLWRLTPRI